MRAGACPIQQALTTEATTIVRQSLHLAKRRGHAQVTPLHVAHTMLASSTGLLRTACMQSHSHPLQCKALELCFNVALNRLPASTSTPMLTTHNHQPLLSNALVAAFKRAQAHQRRGSIENQQQPLLAVKVEIEQLIISILDDPSVSRVMREAGFSSTQVKNNVEQAVSLEICSNPSLSKPQEPNLVLNKNTNSQFGCNYVTSCSSSSPLDMIKNEDVMSVVENLASRRRRCTVIVGECLTSSESVLRGVMAKVDKGDVPEVLRNVRFVTLPLFSFGNLSKDEVDQKLVELRCLLKSFMGRGVVLYLGDLKGCGEFRGDCSEQVRKWYCPVEHISVELGRYVSGIGESGRVWIVGIATYQTYMRCKLGYPSLETVLGLHPLPIPAGSLGLSLNLDSDLQLRSEKNGDGSSWSLVEETVEKQQLTCCSDCLSKFHIEAQSLSNHNNQDSNLPSWLQQYKEENKRLTTNDPVRELCKKWNSLCNSIHKQLPPTEITLNFSSISPSSSISYDHQSWKNNQFWISDKENTILTLTNFTKQNHNSNPPSVTSSETMEMEIQRFKQFSAEGLKSLCNALELKAPWQKIMIPEIASTVLQCRSGMTRRKGVKESKEDTSLFFNGGDSQGKEKIARELAAMVFGSENRFVSIGFSSFSSITKDQHGEFRGKRCRDESSSGSSYLERFIDAISNNPHCVFFLEDIEQVDYYSQLGVKNGIERGRVRDSEGNEVRFSDAIIILSCDSSSRSRSRVCSPQVKQKCESGNQEDGDSVEKEETTTPCVSLDLNLSVEESVGVGDESSIDVEMRRVVDRCFVFEVQEVS